jgi:excisionase family DNA binding protein
MRTIPVFPQRDHPVTEMVKVHHAARTIGCSTRTVRRMIQQGKLKALRLGQRSWAILRSDVECFRNQKELSC